MAIKKRKDKKSGNKKDPSKVVLLNCRSTFMQVLKLVEDDNDNRICRTGILLPKKDKKQVKGVESCIEYAAKKKGIKIKKNSNKFHYPLIDCDEMADDEDSSIGDESRGNWFLSAKAYKIPQVVDRSNERISDIEDLEEICVSGYYFHFSISFRGFDNESKGVRVLLNNLMFRKEGERLDGGQSAESEFENYAEESDDDDDDEWED